MPEAFDAPIDPDWLRADLRSLGPILVLAMRGGLVVGQCAGVVHRLPDTVTALYENEVGTALTHRRTGIAQAMMDARLDWGRARRDASRLGLAPNWTMTPPPCCLGAINRSGPRRAGSTTSRCNAESAFEPPGSGLKRFAFDLVHRIKRKTQQTFWRECLGVPPI